MPLLIICATVIGTVLLAHSHKLSISPVRASGDETIVTQAVVNIGIGLLFAVALFGTAGNPILIVLGLLTSGLTLCLNHLFTEYNRTDA